MRTHNILFSIHMYIKDNQFKLSQICINWIFFMGLKDEFEKAMVNEPSLSEPAVLAQSYSNLYQV